MRTVMFLATCFTTQLAFGFDCTALKALKLESTTIAMAEIVPAGTFKPPYGNVIDKVPAFCRVAGVITPTRDSYIRFEVWLPEIGWNQKMRGVGNGGFAGSIDYRGLSGNIGRGYATAATDTGHEGDSEDASWAYQHPEKIVDFGYRAFHSTTVNAKAIIKAFYNQAPQHAYFDSCSDGGREALMEAQRFPEDYDGILAGAPAYDWTHLVTNGIPVLKMMIANPGGYISSTKLPAITAAVQAACDVEDGLKDGVVSDPMRCHFDPSVLRCIGPENRNCLTDPQITSLKAIYSGARSPHFVPGSESGAGAWADWVIGPGPGGASSVAYLENYLRYMVYGDPSLNVLKVNADEALALADRNTGKALNAVDTDLSKFQARGGKLIIYHGWNDPAISPYFSISYREGLIAKMGLGKVDQFARLYMVPGMQHCYGGPGASAIGQLGIATAKGSEYGVYDALEQWVERGEKPGEIIATKYAGDNPTGKVVLTRPLCPFPQVPRYKGTGDPSEASSFACESSR